MKLLNEINPPLDEALMHYGVKGMRWGVRRKSQGGADYDPYDDYDFGEKRDSRNRKIATAALVTAGIVATGIVLHKTGKASVPALAVSAFQKVNADGKHERARAGNAARNVRDAYKKSDFANRTFRPEEVRNPLWSRIPKPSKASTMPRDFVDAGFGKDGVFNVTTMARGTERVRRFDPDIWEIPMLELTSGRK